MYDFINADTLPLAAMESIQFGHALDRILQEVVLADPSMGPVQLLKVDLSDGFYHVNLNVDDIPKLDRCVFSYQSTERFIAFPLVLPMG